ncbi:myo-inositol 2-dehydrogenase/D-chiro-inositol 1-dehydrogenase [Microbacteriaceae bacterium MWH-Ta3]|nr:myo-inositol 2-dehydrogenase/D-chiro-inositol 1-dehydrogenase [Microbacteriaceae bacterium MWH-Ta3]
MSEIVRVGLIGTGRIGQVHALSVANTSGAELTVVCDTFVDGANAVAALYGGRVVTDPADVFASGEVDLVIVASPTSTHVDLINQAIDAGIHVLCEKPIDLDIDRVDSLRAKAAAADIHIALGFNRRFDPNFAGINARVAAGELGTLEQLIIISRDPAPAPQSYIAVSGGIFRDMTIHDFDMARFFVPDIVEVTATGSNVFSDYIKEEGDFDSVLVQMKGRGGELISIVNSRHSSFGYDQRLEAFGSDGMLYAHNVAPNTVAKYSAAGVEDRTPYMEFFLERYATAYQQELAVFIDGVRTGTMTNPTFEDGRAALVLANAALESATTGRSVSVDGKL